MLASFPQRKPITDYGHDGNRSFNKLILEAIEAGISNALGDSAKDVIFYHLEKKYALERNNLPNRLEEFSNGLKVLFGPGAEVLEHAIAKNIYSKLNIAFEEESEKTLISYIELAKRKELEV